MTNEEAIRLLKVINTEGYTVNDVFLANEMAIEALERRVSRKVTTPGCWWDGRFVVECPRCGKTIDAHDCFCTRCGQAIRSDNK